MKAIVSTNLVEKYLRFLNQLTEEELQMLNANEADILFSVVEKQPKHESKPSFPETMIEETMLRLHKAQTREEGNRILAATPQSKAFLLQLARKIDLPVTRADNMKRIHNQIIEGTIGYRLRSQAIRNTQLH